MIQKSFKTKYFLKLCCTFVAEEDKISEKSDFLFNADGTGARYVRKTTDELTKNRRQDDEGFEGGVMHEKPGSNCPVASFELYLSHLNPLNEFLFQRPKRNVSISENVWYDNEEGIGYFREP